MKNRLLTTLFAAVISTTALSLAQAGPSAKALIEAQMKQAQHITPAELNQKMQSDNDIILLDVRQKSERPIMGALSDSDLHIPRGFLEIKAYSKIPDRNAEIAVFCGKGIRSAFAANTLTEMGYKNVKSLKGGVKAWKEAGFATVTPQ